MLNRPNPYLQQSIQTASPGQLLLMLYDGAIKQCKIGIDGIKNNHLQQTNTALIKCQDIIQEMMITLDQDSDLAKQLVPLYDYFLYLLREGNIKKASEPVQEVLGYLQELKETWQQALQTVRHSEAKGLVQTGAGAHE